MNEPTKILGASDFDRLEFELDHLGHGKVSVNGTEIAVNKLELVADPAGQNITVATITMFCTVKGAVLFKSDQPDLLRKLTDATHQVSDAVQNLDNESEQPLQRRKGREFL